MQQLGKREAQIMQAIWQLEHAFIRDIIELLPDPKPHYNTVSTMVKILEEKGFVTHESLGNAYRYRPLIRKEDYQGEIVDDLVRGYFDNSPMKLVNFFAREQKLDPEDLERLIRKIKEDRS